MLINNDDVCASNLLIHNVVHNILARNTKAKELIYLLVGLLIVSE